MSNTPAGDRPGEVEQAQTPKAMRDFTHALRVHLPARLGQLRALGRETRALTGRRPKR